MNMSSCCERQLCLVHMIINFRWTKLVAHWLFILIWNIYVQLTSSAQRFCRFAFVLGTLAAVQTMALLTQINYAHPAHRDHCSVEARRHAVSSITNTEAFVIDSSFVETRSGYSVFRATATSPPRHVKNGRAVHCQGTEASLSSRVKMRF